MSDLVTDEMRAIAHHAYRRSALQQAGECAAFDKREAINAALAAVAPLIAAQEREAILAICAAKSRHYLAIVPDNYDEMTERLDAEAYGSAYTANEIAAAIRARGAP